MLRAVMAEIAIAKAAKNNALVAVKAGFADIAFTCPAG
jgi:hypothetical protein